MAAAVLARLHKSTVDDTRAVDAMGFFLAESISFFITHYAACFERLSERSGTSFTQGYRFGRGLLHGQVFEPRNV